MKEDMFRVGVITSTHGLAGEVKVFPTTEEPARFLDLDTVCVGTEDDRRELTIDKVRFFKQFVILHFQGLERIEDVTGFLKKELWIRRDQALPLEEGEYYIPDLIGLKVWDDQGRLLGVLTDVLQTGANDVYAVQRGDGTELLIPVIKDCILNVDLEAGTVTVHLLPGLEDLN